MISTVMAIASVSSAARPVPAISSTKVGDTYEITLDRESTGAGPDGSSGSTSDRDAVVERVMAVKSDGVELEYDLPRDTSAEEKRSQWQLPTRIFRPIKGDSRLLNADELNRRADPWLEVGEMTRAVCGHLLFTWNAFQIDCDP